MSRIEMSQQDDLDVVRHLRTRAGLSARTLAAPHRRVLADVIRDGTEDSVQPGHRVACFTNYLGPRSSDP